MALFYFLIVSDSFFLPVAEIQQGIAWMFLLFATTIYLGNRRVNILLVAIPLLTFGSLAISSHPIVAIPTVFLWVYHILEKKNWPFYRNQTILLSCLLTTVMLLQLIFNSDPYDNAHLQGVTHFSLSDTILGFNTPVVKVFLRRTVTNYWFAVLVFFAGLMSLLNSGHKLLAAWTLTSVIGYVLLMGLTFGNLGSDTRLFYIETEWVSLGIIIGAPFVFASLPGLKGSRAAFLLVLIFSVRIAYIAGASPAFHWRTQFIDRTLAQMRKKGITKLAIYQDPYLREKFILDWAVTYETLLASGLAGDEPRLTFFIVKREDSTTLGAIKNIDVYYNLYNVMPASKLDSRYFSIDTLQQYHVMTCEELFR